MCSLKCIVRDQTYLTPTKQITNSDKFQQVPFIVWKLATVVQHGANIGSSCKRKKGGINLIAPTLKINSSQI
ncbi:MAG: hypothetical protein EOP04_02730 [Proteobacteria bacterium]|nr:MAG: hypothetical protein EOP04_02730 [Pseudomonadota bacterium]